MISENPGSLAGQLSAQQIADDLETARIEAQLRAEERRDIIKMRKSWSKWILICIVSIVFFDFLIISLLGLGVISFQGLVVPAIIADSLIKVLGLAMIVVNFLFNKESTSD